MESAQMKAAAPPVIEPTVGRVVWLYIPPPNELSESLTWDSGPFAAIVAAAEGSSPHWRINVISFRRDGTDRPWIEVPLIQPGQNLPPAGAYCTWMPYQVGQAKKVEELSQAVIARVDEVFNVAGSRLGKAESRIAEVEQKIELLREAFLKLPCVASMTISIGDLIRHIEKAAAKL